MIHVKYVYSAPCHVVDSSDCAYMHIHLRYRPTRYLPYMAYMPNLVGVSVSSTYLSIICKVFIGVGSVDAHMYKNVRSIC